MIKRGEEAFDKKAQENNFSFPKKTIEQHWLIPLAHYSLMAQTLPPT